MKRHTTMQTITHAVPAGKPCKRDSKVGWSRTRMRPADAAIEALEPRIAPASATFISPTTATFDDVDDDRVTVKFSKPILSVGNLGTVLVFNPRGYASMDLTTVASAVGTDITVTVAKAPGGDGRVDIGSINATGMDLGKITLPGDLGRLNAGDPDYAIAGVASLTAESIGRMGNQSGASQQLVEIVGSLGGLTLKGDLCVASFVVTNHIGFVKIGGSLVGGSLTAQGNIGPVKIGGDVVGTSIVNSGVILASGKLTSVTIGGSLVGGPMKGTGNIYSLSDCGPIKIAGDIRGGWGESTGTINIGGMLAGVSVGGSLIGGMNLDTGLITATLDTGPITIVGDIRGGTGDNSGSMQVNQKLASLKVGGSIVGGVGYKSGRVLVKEEVGSIGIARNVLGAIGDLGGRIEVGTFTSLTIGSSLRGGSGVGSGSIAATDDSGPIKIGNDVAGGSGNLSGSITVGAPKLEGIVSLTIGGSLLGGSGIQSGAIQANNIGKLKITHNIIGGSAKASGLVNLGGTSSILVGGSIIGGSGDTSGGISAGTITALKVGGSIVGGADVSSGGVKAGKIVNITIGGSLIGGSANYTGAILSFSKLDTLKIGGSIVGSDIFGTMPNVSFAGAVVVSNGGIGSVVVKGSLLAGLDESNVGALIGSASITSDSGIRDITIGGNIAGTSTPSGTTFATIAAAGSGTSMAIGKLTVAGRVEFAKVLAGYNATITPTNADAQIGTVKIGRDLIASSIVAGAIPGADGFGNTSTLISGGDAAILAKIASITIGGRILGTPGSINTTDRHGIVAEEIGSIKVRGISLALTAGPHNNTFQILPNTDFYVHEI